MSSKNARAELIEEPSEHYRPDADGLRAVAILAVVAFHFSESLVPAGLLGVDVFFVISGFVITATLFRSAARSGADFLIGFYARRLRRLAPALIVCLSVTSLLLCLFDPEPTSSLRTGLFALFGLSNFHLNGLAGDYFSGPAQLNPFTHTWSLGVEEQFYLIFPLLLILAGVHRRKPGSKSMVARLLLSVGLCSLAAFWMLGGLHNPVSFYMMPMRFWELATGALAFLVSAGQGNARRTWSASLLPHALLALICVLFFVRAGQSSAGTVMVVLASAILLVLGSGQGLRPAILVSAPVIFMGKISYSLYLWHWPVLVLARWTIGVDAVTAPFLLALALVLAVLSYFAVEQPFRTRWPAAPALRVVAVGAGSLGLAAIVQICAVLPFHAQLYSGKRPSLEASGVRSLSEPYSVPGTELRWAGSPCVMSGAAEVGKVLPLDECTLGDPQTAKRRVWVLGDSFAAAFVAGFDRMVASGEVSVTLLASWGAAPVPQIAASPARASTSVDFWSRVVPEVMAQARSGDAVLLINDLSTYAAKQGEVGQGPDLGPLRHGLATLAHALWEREVRLAVLYGIPFAMEADCEPSAALVNWFNLGRSPCKFYSRDETLRRRASLHAMFKALEIEAGLTAIDVVETFCAETICTYESVDGAILYRDSYAHASIEAARLAQETIRAGLLRDKSGAGGSSLSRE